jgi:lipid A ethanolaminephosphotransferase
MKWFHSVLPEKVTITRLVLAVSLFFVLFDNLAFFRNVTAAYPVSVKNLAYIGLTAMLLYLVIVLLLIIFSYRHTTKPILVLLLLISSLTGYFMDSYNVFIDSTMV